TPRQLRPAEQGELLGLGLGITNVVARATARADELDAEEFRAGGAALTAKVERLAPQWLAVVGITAYR
ncbi:mismatch-specific DNA-glycosylase, partial [Streptomyces sp. SID7982]|nr:mismatch-specific DNA-glycosylase [Streptomyces sp. SID7982]